jgi:hypothetical protein
MSAVFTISGFVLAFVSASGFLFGQLLFGNFSLPASIAGVCGLLAACGAFGLARGSAWAPRLALWAGAATVLGVALDAAHYYMYNATPGNYYAWAIVGPFVICAAFIAFAAARRRRHGPK